VEVLVDRELVVDGGGLGREPEVAPRARIGRGRLAAEQDGAFVWSHQAGEHEHQRRLSRPVGAEQADHLASGDLEVDTGERLTVSTAESDSAHVDRRALG
jgi:hypothetical protein